MKNVFTIKYLNVVFSPRCLLMAMMTLWSVTSHLNAQCVPSPGIIEGVVFKDSNNDGQRNGAEWGVSGVVVTATGENGILLGTSVTNGNGVFEFAGLTDNQKVRLTYQSPLDYFPAVLGQNNASNVQQVTVPLCNVTYGLASEADLCHEGTEILTTCFVQGTIGENTMEPTIVGIEYGFTSSTPARKFAAHSETGSIWGITWKASTKEIFSSSFIKQHSGLHSGHDAIFVTSPNGSMHSTQKFVKLSELGVDVSDLEVTDPRHCDYGKQVGKKGLGAMVLSPDENYLYVVDIENHQLVRIPTVNPQISNTITYPIPTVGNESYPFALKYYNDAIYIGVTEPGQGGHIYKFYPEFGDIEELELTVPVGNDWVDNPVVGGAPSLWLTDIDFSDEGHMMISLTDRIGHIYCNEFSSRLDEQKGELYMAFKNGATWELEDRSGGQLFFNEAYWATNPSYHSKITTGSIFAMPGTQSVVSTVFDPESNSYSGGLHRYSTENGAKIGSKELYSLQTTILFGKAVGFGDIIATCEAPKIEIGNLVWLDVNSNGIQDAGEPGMENIPVQLLDANCTVIAQTVTDSRGYYTFNNNNVLQGIKANTTYFIALDNSIYHEESNKYLISGSLYQPTMTNESALMTNNKMNDLFCDFIVVEVNTNQTSHNFDIGLMLSGDCDLKISARVVNEDLISVNNSVEFEILILNQGSQIISSLDLEQPLIAAYSFDASKNVGWVLENGVLSRTLEGALAPNQSVATVLTLDFDKLSPSKIYTTETQITAVSDLLGNDIEMTSCFDPTENRQAQATPEICDLALKHVATTSQITLPNNSIELTTTVCNQGTMDAETFEIVNYFNPEFDFDPAKNEGWTINQELTELTYVHDLGLKPGACMDISLFVSLKPTIAVSQIVNYAEISLGQCQGRVETSYDFDSTFDNNPNNDKGGRPNTETDNMMDDKGEIDEDDHDPAVVRINLVDLSIRKYVVNRNVNSGDEIEFFFDVQNIGREPVSKFVLSDYLPEYIDVIDDTWSTINGVATKGFVFDGGFQPGQTFTTSIKCQIRQDAKDPSTLTNRVVIEEIYDLQDLDIKSNDGPLGNLPEINNLFEDDEDFTIVVINRHPEVGVCHDCRQATNSVNGQFLVDIRIASAPNEDWYVESAIGLFDVSSPLPPGAPIPLNNASPADTLFLSTMAFPGDPTHTYYHLSALHIDKQGFYLVLRNKFGAIEIVDIAGRTCSFESMSVNGPTSLCTGAEASYTVSSSANLVTTYSWSVCDSEGVCTDLSDTGATVNINWEEFGNGVYILRASANSGCVVPAELRVAVGSAETGSIACIGDFQVSLDGNCEMMITPQMLVAGSLSPTSPYTVMLKDMHGNAIPNATLTSVHVGTTIMAKLIEGCGGNSCWSNIRVEDKTPPISLCQPNITIPCVFLDDYTGPFESDNCDGPITNAIVNEEITPVCSGNVIKYIDRVYQATDARGNKSDFCSFRITVTRPDFSESAGFLQFPSDLTMDNALLCSEFKMDENGRPHPDVSGVPTYAGRKIFPVVDNGCNTSVWYTDNIIVIGCITKVMRTWHVYEQCSSDYEHITYLQTIEITDNKAPFVAPYPDVSISTSGKNCVGNYTIAMPTVVDTCSSYVVVDVTYPGGYIGGMKQATSVSLPISDMPHEISVKVTDACGNSSTVSFTVTISDLTPPVTICKGELVTGLSSLGEAYIKASAYDDGSYDDCTITKMLVRRMDDKPCGDCDVPSIEGFRYLGAFTNLGKSTPHYYYLSRHQSHAATAFKMAEAVGGYLVSINNTQESQWLQDAVTPWISESPYLIGLRDIKNKNDFKWASEEALNYTKWSAGHPLANSPYVKVGHVNSNWQSFNDNGAYWYIVEITDPCGFSDEVKFCCEDVTDLNAEEANPQTVVFRAIDKSGNWNECMVTTIVQDKHKPEIICPDNEEMDCSDVFSGMDLTQFGEAIPVDGCGATVRELSPVFDLDACRVGEITRFFEATDGTNTATCRQIIAVGNLGRFNPSTDIQWPDDYTVLNVCGMQDLSPDNLPEGFGNPVLTQSDCGLAAPSHKDRVFEFIPDACFKIVRTWTVIDWCEMERLGEDYKPATHTQTIKVLNDIAPDINTEIVQDTVFVTEKGNCIDGQVSLSVTASDVCTPDNRLRWKVRIDTLLRGIFDIERSGFGPIASINEILPVGNHLIQWIFEDRCGNVTTREQSVIVRNNDKPVANGLECVTVAITPWDTDGDGSPDIEKGCIQAYTLNASSYSLCCEEDLRFSFSVDINDVERCFDCADVDEEIFVELWVHDCNGNTDFVRVCVDVQDNNDSNICEEICIINPAVAEVTGETTICSTSQTTLTATGGVEYLWSTGATTPSITVSPLSTTVYSVTVTDRFNCTDDASVSVTVNPLPTGEITGDDVCLGSSTLLTASGGTSYLWSTGETTTSISVAPLVNTSYTVTVTNDTGCESEVTTLVIVNPLPEIFISGTNQICLNDRATLTASGATSYVWSTGATTASITVSPLATTTYSVTATDSNGCEATEEFTLTVAGVSNVARITVQPATICLGQNTTLSAILQGGTPASYLWSTGATTSSITVSPGSTTTYSVTITDTNGCRAQTTTTVTVNPLPVVAITGDNICFGESTDLTASGGVAYQWNTGATTATITVSPTSSTTYTVTVTNNFGCTSVATRRITVFPLPNAQIAPANVNICLNESIALTASGGASYMWSTGETTTTINVSPSMTTTYTVTVTNSSGCVASSSRIVIVSGVGSLASIQGPSPICLGESSTLSASLTGGTPLSYLWSNGATTPSITVSPAVTTTYSVTITDTNGCNAQASRILTVNPLPAAAITGDNICVGETASLTASGGGSYQWNTGATTPTITVSPAVNTTFTVTVTSSLGCTSTATRVLQVFPLPNAQISPANVNICLNEAINLVASGGVTYIWNTGQTTSIINVSPANSTTYTVTVTNGNGCVASSSRIVTVSGIGSLASIQGTSPICLGESSTLSASLTGGTPLSYLWSNGATTSSIIVSPGVTTTYSVTITDTNGCNAQASFPVTVQPLPVASIVGDNICVGETASLTASGGVSYQWNTGATTPTITVSPAVNTTFTVTVTSSLGCTSTATRLLQVFPLPNAQISPANVEICLDENTDLVASGGVSYMWNTGETTTTISVSPNTTTTYTVTVTSAEGCVANSSRTVVVNGIGLLANIQGTSPICLGESSTLTASLTGGTISSYLWSTGATTPSIIVSPIIATTYSVTITDSNGCDASASITVNVNPLPVVEIDGQDVCPGESTTLTASGGVSYVWSTNETTSSIVVTPSSATTYTVTATDANGCSNSEQFTVDILPVPIVNITGDNIVCEGSSTTLTASGGVAYVWSTGETTPEIEVSPNTTSTYTVTVTGDNTCTNTAEIIVTVNPNPEPVITGDLMICVGDTAFLTASPGVSFNWSTGDTTATIEVIPVVNTSYSVTVTDANGCTGSTSAMVFVDQGNLVCETQDITVYLPPSGMIEIGVEDISTGTLGACANITAMLDRTFFACNDITSSPIIVTLTVTNNNTNQTLTCTAQVTVLDTLPPTILCPGNQTINCQDFDPDAPLFTYGGPTTSDNCPLGLNTTEVPVIDLNICNDGLITRTFTVTDGSGNSSQCVQSITIVNPVTFSEVAITWPSDVTISNCDDTSVDSLGNITIDDTLYDCAELTFSDSDDFPTGVLCGGEFSRIFTVTDACTDTTYTYTQSITVNVEQPQIFGSVDTVCIFRDTMTCLAEFEGSADFSATGCNLTFTANITLPDGRVMTITDWDLDGEYEDGFTQIELIVTESCNDLADTLSFVIEVKPVETAISCEKTYPEITDLLIVEETVYDHVDIIQGCDVTNTIVASYSNTDINDTMRVYGCGDLPNAPIPLTIYFWVTGASAPFDLCQSLVGLSDPNRRCMSIGHRIAGNVHTEDMVFVPNVEVDLDGSGLDPIITNLTGNYGFPEMDSGGEYRVKPKKDNHYLDGVSTLDLIFIQKHLLGDRLLPTPYKMIAADINKDNRISASDLVELRKLILGVYNKFPSNTSWRMVDENYVFPDLQNPFMSRFAEEYHIENLNSSMIINWVGVKIGDVNNSYKPNANDVKSFPRSRNLYLTVPYSDLKKGWNTLPVKASMDADINGFQISLPISGAYEVRINSGLLDIKEDQYTYNEGVLHISWNDVEAKRVDADDILFTLEIEMLSEDKIHDVLLTNESMGLNPEWYTEQLESKSLGWRLEKEDVKAFELYGNVPNPWKNETAINFYLPEAGDVMLRVRDVTGRILYQTNSFFQTGDNSFRISNDLLDVSGLLIYDIAFKNEIKTNKMLNIK